MDQLDFSASYALSDRLLLTLDAKNILKSEYRDYFASETLYPRDARGYERYVGMGVRFRY